MENTIEVEGLTKSFRITNQGDNPINRLKSYVGMDAKHLPVLQSLDLKIKKGEIYGLLGPNGSGKTTLLRILSTTMLPDSGKVMINGHDAAIERNKDKISASTGAVLGDRTRSFYWRLTTRQNLEFYASLYGLDGMEKAERIDYLLEKVGLTHKRDELLTTYSTGMFSKLAIARAFLHSPEVLLLDEFLSNLDPRASADARDIIRNLAKKEGRTVLFTTNNAYEAELLADRIGILYKGKISAEGTPDELKKRFGSKETTIRLVFDSFPRSLENAVQELKKEKSIKDAKAENYVLSIKSTNPTESLEKTLKIVRNEGGYIRNIMFLNSTLEDVFINVTRD